MSSREPGDEELARWIEGSLAGDEEAFASLVEAKRGLVLRTAWQQLGDGEEAREVAQAVFVRLWQHLDRFDRTRRFDTWLYRLTINAAIDHHRRRRARPWQTGFDETFDTQAAPAPAGAEAERGLQEAEIARILQELAGLLTEKQRQAFLLREVEGLSTAEVAGVLRSTESTVRNHVFQARRVLTEALRERYPEYAPTPPGASASAAGTASETASKKEGDER